MITTLQAGKPIKDMTVRPDNIIANEKYSDNDKETPANQPKPSQNKQGKKKQMSIEFFASPMSRKKHLSETESANEKVIKKARLNPPNEEKEQHFLSREDIRIDGEEESEESVDREIMDLATESDHEEVDEVEIISEKISRADDDASQPELRKLKREQEREQKRKQKQLEEDKKRVAKQQKKEEEAERRRFKKEKEEEERRLKRERIEAEREAKRQQKEREKVEKQKRKEEEARLKEERKKREEEQKAKKKEELERRKHEKFLEKQKIEKEKEQKKLEEEMKIKKRSITNFFKVKPSLTNTEAEAPKILNGTPGGQAKTTLAEESVKSTEQSEFQQYFLPFYVKPNAKVADTVKNGISTKWDELLKSPYSFIGESNITIPSASASEGKTERAFSVLKCLNSGSMNEANRLFHQVPLRYIKFYENKRSPYLGTFSYTTSDIEEPDLNLKLHPWSKVTLKRSDGAVETGDTDKIQTPVINYDYDSDFEADNGEGEEDEDGEDLNSADEEDDDDEEMGSSDIDEFVEKDSTETNAGEREDGTNEQTKKRRVMGPLIPVLRHCHEEVVDGDEFGEYFTTLRWERLNSYIDFPIDPFKDYWQSSKRTEKIKEEDRVDTQTQPSATKNTVSSALMNGAKDSNASGGAGTPAQSATPLGVKKKVITNADHVRILLAFVDSHKTLSLNTLAELAVKDGANQGVLGDYSRAVVKNTVKANASFDKKNGWQVQLN